MQSKILLSVCLSVRPSVRLSVCAMLVSYRKECTYCPTVSTVW